jgi:hypothetical protein
MEADVFIIASKPVSSTKTITVKIVSLQDRDVVFDNDGMWYRDCNRLRDRDCHGLGHVDRDRHWIRDLNRVLHWVRDWPLHGIRHWLFNWNRIRLRDMHRIGPVYRDWEWHFYRNRDVSLDSDRVWLRHRDRDFFRHCDCLQVSFVSQAVSQALSQTVSQTVSQTEPVVLFLVPITQAKQSPFVLFLVFLRGHLIRCSSGNYGNHCQQNCQQLKNTSY